MRVSKVKLSEDTLIEVGELGGKTIGLGSQVVSSAEEVGGGEGLVFILCFVSADRAATGAAASPQVVCGGAVIDDVSGGGGGGGEPRGSLNPPALESVWPFSHQSRRTNLGP